MGGVGNQFFQVARAISLREEGFDVEILQLRRFKEFAYKTLKFSIHDEWIDLELICLEANLSIREISFPELLALSMTFFRKKIGLSCDFDEPCFKDGEFNHSSSLRTIDVGYFQSLDHISHTGVNAVVGVIIKVLNLTPESYSAPFVAHVRGGDFDINDRLDTCAAKEIIHLGERLDCNITVVTDDAKYVERIFLDGGRISTVCGGGALSDFVFLSRARTLYLSNSTFSLWAALCSFSLNKTNIYYNRNFPFSEVLNTDHQGRREK